MFWVREKKQSSAEVDLVHQHKQLLIPVEVKSGSQGRLRSLHEFIDRCDHPYSIRLYADQVRIDNLQTIRGNKPFYLLNLPYFLATRLPEYVEWLLK